MVEPYIHTLVTAIEMSIPEAFLEVGGPTAFE